MQKLKDLLNEEFQMEMTYVSNILPKIQEYTDEELMRHYEMRVELAELLNKFWKKYNVPFHLRGPKKKPKLLGRTKASVAAKKAEEERLEKKAIEKAKRKEMKRKQQAGSPKKGELSAQPRFGSGTLKSKFRK
jgi:hypothetical protein